MIEFIRQYWSRTAEPHRQIALDFVLVGSFVLVGKLAGAAKEMAIAWRYGVSATVDAYVFTISFVTWPVGIWAGILTVVLVPLAASLRSGAPDELPRFRAELLGFTLLLSLCLGLFIWLLLTPLLNAGWLGLSEPVLREAIRMKDGLSLLTPLGVVISMFSILLLSARRHRNTLFEAIPALILLLFLLIPVEWMPEPLIWGTLVGFIFHAVALAIPLNKYGELSLPQIRFSSPAWRLFWASIGIMIVGQIMASGANMVDQFLAAGLDEGSLSTLGYANRILALIMGLGATAISRATLPVFSGVRITSSDAIKPLAIYWVALMFLLGVAALIVMWFFAPLVVRILFERGAFSSADTSIVSTVLKLCLLQVPFYFPALVLVSALAAQGRHFRIALSGMLNLIIKLPIAFLLVRLFDLEGLVISTAIMYLFSTMILYALVVSK